jgi:hypothetical protein
MQQIPEAKTKPACDQRQEKQHGANEHHNDRGNDGCPYDFELLSGSVTLEGCLSSNKVCEPARSSIAK